MSRNWDEHYTTGQTPWDRGEPDPNLVRLIESGRFPMGRSLDIGCGTGTNARYLERSGYDVVGIDISKKAIEKATAALPAGSRIQLKTLDILKEDPPAGPFDFIFDRGCFHVFDDPKDQARFADRVAGCLAPNGFWLSLLGSTEGAPREFGPPRRSARDVMNAVEPVLRVVEFQEFQFDVDMPGTVMAWMLIACHRTHPAQASTDGSQQ